MSRQKPGYPTGTHVYILPTKQCGVIEGYNLPEMKDRYKVNGRYYRKSELVPVDEYFWEQMEPNGWWIPYGDDLFVLDVGDKYKQSIEIDLKYEVKVIPETHCYNGVVITEEAMPFYTEALKHAAALKTISQYNTSLNSESDNP